MDDGGEYEAKLVMSGEAFDVSIAIGDDGGSLEETDLDAKGVKIKKAAFRIKGTDSFVQ